MRGVHGEKLVAALNSEKLPLKDYPRVKDAIDVYDHWIADLKSVEAETVRDIVETMVSLLNAYKRYIDLELIFDSPEDFLYRQKGQLKIDNTIVEEFLPILVSKCLASESCAEDLVIDSQTKVFSTAYFATSLNANTPGGGLSIKTKDQDFSICRELHILSSFDDSFEEDNTVSITTYLGYTLAEIKTNLDKTMFQEASATAHDVKLAVTGAKYYLLCEYLDMTPLSSATTDIDEIMILRKAKRLSSNIRKDFSSSAGRKSRRGFYEKFLDDHPFDAGMFMRFVEHVLNQFGDRELEESAILDMGYF